jgi:hypothetical protein
MKKGLRNLLTIGVCISLMSSLAAGCSRTDNGTDISETTASSVAEATTTENTAEQSIVASQSVTSGGTDTNAQAESVVIDGITYHIGDIYTFGNYGNVPITWIILDIDGENVMLLSEYAVDSKNFNEELVETSWEECTVRTWLNSEFTDNAFNDEEKAKILDTNVVSSPNPEYGIQSGNDTSDKVFLLSASEFEELVPEQFRQCLVTDYAWEHNVMRYNSNNCCDWFLRTPGTSAKVVTYVTYNGLLYTPGRDVTFSVNGIRPAIWINTAG